MQVDISILFSACSLIVAIIVAVSNIRNKNYLNDRESASQTATLIVKLENIADGVNEIKSDMKSIRTDVESLRERLVKVEQSTKQAHKRIDRMEGIEGGQND